MTIHSIPSVVEICVVLIFVPLAINTKIIIALHTAIA